MTKEEMLEGQRRNVPDEIRELVRACQDGEDLEKPLSKISAEDMGDFVFGIDWRSEEAAPIVEAYRRDRSANKERFAEWLPDPLPGPPNPPPSPLPPSPPPAPPPQPPVPHPLPGVEVYRWLEGHKLLEVFRRCIICCCWWCRCCSCNCGCDCFPPQLCKCCCLVGRHELDDICVHTGRLSRTQLPDGFQAEVNGIDQRVSDAEALVGAVEGRVSDLENIGGEPNNIADAEAERLSCGALTESHFHMVGYRHTRTEDAMGAAFGVSAEAEPTLTIDLGKRNVHPVDTVSGDCEITQANYTYLSPEEIHVSFAGRIEKPAASGIRIPLILGDWKVTEGIDSDANKLFLHLRLYDVQGDSYDTVTNEMSFRVDVFGLAGSRGFFSF